MAQEIRIDSNTEKDLMDWVLNQSVSNKILNSIHSFCLEQPPVSMTLYRGQDKHIINPSFRKWFSTSSDSQQASAGFTDGECCLFVIHILNVPVLNVNKYIGRKIVSKSEEKEFIVLGGGTFYKDPQLSEPGFLVDKNKHGKITYECWYSLIPRQDELAPRQDPRQAEELAPRQDPRQAEELAPRQDPRQAEELAPRQDPRQAEELAPRQAELAPRYIDPDYHANANSDYIRKRVTDMEDYYDIISNVSDVKDYSDKNINDTNLRTIFDEIQKIIRRGAKKHQTDDIKKHVSHLKPLFQFIENVEDVKLYSDSYINDKNLKTIWLEIQKIKKQNANKRATQARRVTRVGRARRARRATQARRVTRVGRARRARRARQARLATQATQATRATQATQARRARRARKN
jgi:hypothetical protein